MHRELRHELIGRIGLYAYGVGSAAAGVMDAIWGDFDPAHQPIQALGDHIPGRAILAYLTAAWMIAGGIAIMWPRTRRAGGAMLAIIYAVFTVFWLPRFYTAPQVLGFRLPLVIALLAGAGTQLITCIAGVLLYRSQAPPGAPGPRAHRVALWTFGLCAVAFGLQHVTNLQANAVFVPRWMPLGATFWVIVTGTCFLLAGLAILSGVQDVLAAQLLGLMFLGFNVLTLPQFILANPESHAAWGGNAYNLAAVGSAWILAAALARQRAAATNPGPRATAPAAPLQ